MMINSKVPATKATHKNLKKADPIGFSVLRDTNKIGRYNKFVLKTL